MSFNFVEALLDKLPLPSLSGKEISQKLSGSQNLMDTNSRMNVDIVDQYHHLLDLLPLAKVSPMTHRTGVKNNFQNFEPFRSSLMSRVTKLLTPSFSTHRGLGILSNQSEFQFESDLSWDDRANQIGEMFDQLDFFKVTKTDFPKLPALSNMPEGPINLSDACDQIAAELAQNSTPDDGQAALVKSKVDSCHALNKELINRKEKELNKRSKKRRRRQKNKALNSQKQLPIENSKKPLINKGKILTPSSQSPISKRTGVNCDILCDIVSISGPVNEVQIIVPDLPSFIITVGSGDEDDADWDACSDSEWLNECSEFEFSGLFVANLAAPKIPDCPGTASHLNVPSNNDDKEAHKLQNMLLNVNKTWSESTKDWDRKPKLPAKVSFAPVDELVKVVFVENYERKGEWEIFALERIRFKKRIDELESVLSSCLSKEHREKVFHRIHETRS